MKCRLLLIITPKCWKSTWIFHTKTVLAKQDGVTNFGQWENSSRWDVATSYQQTSERCFSFFGPVWKWWAVVDEIDWCSKVNLLGTVSCLTQRSITRIFIAKFGLGPFRVAKRDDLLGSIGSEGFNELGIKTSKYHWSHGFAGCWRSWDLTEDHHGKVPVSCFNSFLVVGGVVAAFLFFWDSFWWEDESTKLIQLFDSTMSSLQSVSPCKSSHSK